MIKTTFSVVCLKRNMVHFGYFFELPKSYLRTAVIKTNSIAQWFKECYNSVSYPSSRCWQSRAVFRNTEPVKADQGPVCWFWYQLTPYIPSLWWHVSVSLRWIKKRKIKIQMHSFWYLAKNKCLTYYMKYLYSFLGISSIYTLLSLPW